MMQTDVKRSASVSTVARATHYDLYGMRVLSEVPLPIPPLRNVMLSGVDWVVRRGDTTGPSPLPACPPISEDHDVDGTVFDRFYRDGEVAWLWDRQAGTYRMEPRRGRITVYAAEDAVEEDLGLVLLGPVSAYMLQQSGYPTLHASAVVTQHGACAFVGRSGRGKSTLAAGLLRSGARLLSDDVLPLRIGSDGVYGISGPAMMKVWPATATETLGISTDLPRLTPNTSKRRFDLTLHNHRVEGQAAKLRAIYVPQRYVSRRGGPAAVTIEALSPRDAVLALLTQTFRGHYLQPSELVEVLNRYAQLAQQVPVAVLRVPDGLAHLEAVTARILQDLAAA